MANFSSSKDRRHPDFPPVSLWIGEIFSLFVEFGGGDFAVEPMWGWNVPIEGFGTIGRGAFSPCGRPASVVSNGNGDIVRAFQKSPLQRPPQCLGQSGKGNEMFCRAANGALAPKSFPKLFSERLSGHWNMAIISRISETYRRRLRGTPRDVLVAAALTLMAGMVVLAALWKPPAPELHSAGEIHSIDKP